MDLFNIFDLSGAGMSVQKSRMNVISSNLVNAQTTRTPEGGPYQRRSIVFRAVRQKGKFSSMLSADQPGVSRRVLSVEVAGVKTSTQKPKQIYDPGHPDANEQGFVSYPNINVMQEMVDLLSAVRSYEANMTVFNSTKTLIRRVLDLGRLT